MKDKKFIYTVPETGTYRIQVGDKVKIVKIKESDAENEIQKVVEELTKGFK